MKSYKQFITEGINEYEITHKQDGSSHSQMTVVKGATEVEAKANFVKMKPHTTIQKIKKRGWLHKLSNLGSKEKEHDPGQYKTRHSYRTGDDIDPDTIPTFKTSF